MDYESEFFLLRTPLLPLSEALSVFDDRKKRSEIIRKYFTVKLLQESILLASTDLYVQLLRYLDGHVVDRKKVEKLEESLIEYLLRMSARCTPFGLFAGCSVGHFKDSTELTLRSIKDPKAFNKHLRLDMGFQSYLVKQFDKRQDIKQNVRFFPNSSLYKLGKKMRYIEYKFIGSDRKFHLKEVDYHPALGRLLRKCHQGSVLEELIALLEARGFDKDNSEEYINELIESQILLSEFEPSVNGLDFFKMLTSMLRRLKVEEAVQLEKAQDILDTINSRSTTIPVYELVAKIFGEMGLKTPKADKMFQLDLSRNPIVASLSKNIKARVLQASRILYGLNKVNLDTRLEMFKKVFRERYENASVRLVDALDIEVGINFNKLGRYSDFPSSKSIFEANIAKLKKDKFRDFLKKKNREIVITDADLAEANINLDSFNTGSFSALVKILNHSGDALQLESLTLTSFTNLIGRFCNSNPDLKAEVENMLDMEKIENAQGILAEIVHLPDARTGNILNRPHLSKYEIPYLGKSQLPFDKQIPVADLYLRLEGNRLVLFSKRLRREVIPRLSSAHNFSANSLPIYYFLCSLQGQSHQAGATWLWGELEDEMHLPRVSYRGVIFSPETWKLNLADLGIKKADSYNIALIKDRLVSFFGEVDIPDKVYLSNGDNRLLMDLNSRFGQEYLAKKIVKNGSLKLEEFLFTEDDLIVASADGGYVNEFIIPYVKSQKETEKKVPKRMNVPSSSVKRIFEPGSEWLYYKVYMGVKTSNTFLSSVILPLTDRLIKKGLIDRWFFVRYNDPRPHLRIRFKLVDSSWFGKVISEFNKVTSYYVANSLIWTLQLDTYVRELERYGHEKIEFSENFFFINSNFICMVFARLDWNDSVLKTNICFTAFNDMLIAFYPIIEDRRIFVKTALQAFDSRKNVSNRFSKDKMNQKYRSFIGEYEKFVDSLDNDLFLKEILYNNGKIMANEVETLKQSVEISNNGRYGSQLLRSYIHMFCNRVFDLNQNEQEIQMYFFVEKYYISLLARLDHEKKQQVIKDGQ